MINPYPAETLCDYDTALDQAEHEARQQIADLMFIHGPGTVQAWANAIAQQLATPAQTVDYDEF